MITSIVVFTEIVLTETTDRCCAKALPASDYPLTSSAC